MLEYGLLETGMKFPPQINKGTGRFVLSSGAEGVKESLYIILMTQRTERFTRPLFGSNILSYTFKDTSPTILHMMEHEIETIILSQEPRILAADIKIEQELLKNRLLAYIDYTLKDLDTREHMVVPLYGEEYGKLE